ncbi:GLPGLI family protein [Aquimarina algicola]|uniref:GLPGLI family protein n=1 Tax=Aquimarina algicola TaxID=2589995 RepID=A0A504IZG6_9FLAO|nr:GLPGLI family protein [Aquimarina algicola]TPN83916.1 GLPGLI family protein [Aquimarina algicola]
MLIRLKFFKFYFFLIFLLSYKISTGQNQGIITYQKRMTSLMSEKEETKKLAKTKPKYYKTIVNMDTNMKLLLDNMEFALQFKEEESVFEVENTLEHEKNRFLQAALRYGIGEGLYYTNTTSEESLYQTKAIGQTFIVTSKKINWILINETKKIGKYNCYKAKYIEKTKGYEGKEYEKEIIAWYTPEVPVRFGPAGFGNLPGLIISLEYGEFVDFIVKRIDLHPKKKIVIKKPEKGELVTEEDFKKRLDIAMDNAKN